MADESDLVNQATIELLERRLTDRVTETARKRVIAYYVVLGTGFSALATLVGFAAVQWVKDTASVRLDNAIKERTNEIAERAAELSKQQNRAFALQEKIDDLSSRSNQTLGNLVTALNEFSLKTHQLQELNEAVTKLEPRVDAIRALPDIALRNNSDIQTLSGQLADLAKQVAALAAAATKDAPQSTMGSATRYGDIAESTSQVATATTETADRIQAVRARPTVYLQFSGFTREIADQLRTTLAGDSYNFPPAERVGTATGLFEVRYFYVGRDKETADRLAAAATEAARKIVLSETRTAQVIDFTNFRGTKPREGTIELWYGPRN